MSVPTVLPPLEQLGQRPFSFYPAIVNIVHNEWIYRKANWSEVLVQNTRTNHQIWVPRRFLGAVSQVDEPVMIVGLAKELEYRAGALWPVERRVIEMPLGVARAVNGGPGPFAPAPPVHAGPAAVVGIRLESRGASRAGRVVLAGTALAIAGCILAVSLHRGGVLGNRVVYAPVIAEGPGLAASDDYAAVVRALGRPAEDRWFSGELEYRMLGYPRRGIYVVLAGRDRAGARYIGAMDRDWRPVDSVGSGALRGLKRF